MDDLGLLLLIAVGGAVTIVEFGGAAIEWAKRRLRKRAAR